MDVEAISGQAVDGLARNHLIRASCLCSAAEPISFALDAVQVEIL